MIKEITSRDTPLYKELLHLKKGDGEKGLFLAEGEDLYREARKEGALRTLILPFGSAFPKDFENIVLLKDSLYKALSNYKSLPPCILLCEKPYAERLGERIVYLDGIQDPGNLGTIIRTALAFSYDGVALSNDCVSLYNSKVIQSTKGAIFHMPVSRKDLLELAGEGYPIFLTTLDGEDMEGIDSLGERFALVLGNEGHGIRKEYLGLGRKIRIDMGNIDSLNVASAGAIFLYRYRRKR